MPTDLCTVPDPAADSRPYSDTFLESIPVIDPLYRPALSSLSPPAAYADLQLPPTGPVHFPHQSSESSTTGPLPAHEPVVAELTATSLRKLMQSQIDSMHASQTPDKTKREQKTPIRTSVLRNPSQDSVDLKLSIVERAPPGTELPVKASEQTRRILEASSKLRKPRATGSRNPLISQNSNEDEQEIHEEDKRLSDLRDSGKSIPNWEEYSAPRTPNPELAASQ